MIEKIGKIAIDDTHYPGEDLYCDGAVEDEILEIVKTNDAAALGKIIEERKSWPVLYHLSHLRENIVNWIPLKKTDQVLEVGSGCGAITGALSAKAKSVTCIELSKKRSLINACRHPQCDNVTIKLGNFQVIEPELACDYDYIFLIGVFEYAQSYIGGAEPFETFLAILKRHLAPGGRIVIAIENRFGLKYWAGCKEDHLGTYFDGIEGYPHGGGVRTFTRKALEEICRKNRITDYSFYYPYPDYKFMTCVYSDDRLPEPGELSDNMRNFDRDRLLLFDEKNVFDSLIREEMFPQFSNSYVVVIGEPLPVLYARFSNDRAPEFAIRTEIRRKAGAAGEALQRGVQDGTLEVRKIPLTKEAEAHVGRMEETCRKLEAAYAGSGLLLNRCVMDKAEAVFEYLPGKTLEELLDGCLERNDPDGFRKLFDRYCKLAAYPQNPAIYDYDLIFSNIIVTGDQWNLIDYEWVTDRQIPAKELILRALYCYGLGSDKRKPMCLELMREVMEDRDTVNWDEESLAGIIRKEKAFQDYATGNRMSMVEIRNAIAYPIVPAVSLMRRHMEEEHRNRIQIYEDYGQGFSEEGSYFLHKGYQEKETVTVETEAKPGLKALRLDPALDCCIVQVKSLCIGGRPLSLKDKNVKLNGKLISDDTIVFATQDPNITVLNTDKAADGCKDRRIRFHAELEMVRISRAMAESMACMEKEGKQGFHKGLAWLGK